MTDEADIITRRATKSGDVELDTLAGLRDVTDTTVALSRAIAERVEERRTGTRHDIVRPSDRQTVRRATA